MIKTQGHFSQAALAGLALLLWACAGPGPLAAADQKTTGDNSETSTQTKHLVNVNTADAKTLATLPGVGPTIAQHIIDGRPYHSLADLEKVKGLGPSKVAELKGKVTFREPHAKREKTAETVTTTPSTSTSGHAHETSEATGPTSIGSGSSTDRNAANKLAPGERININTASVEELDRLPGIGKTKAQAIVDYRNQNGNFKSPEDIEKVKGIKAGSFEKIKDHIKLSD
jgi:competence protein ComEA